MITQTFNLATNNASLSSGLIAHYKMTGNANDSSGNGYNGTVNGATLITNPYGVSNKAYSFDGLNDYITVADANALSFTNGVNDLPFSISFWMNTTSSSTFGIMGKWFGDAGTPMTVCEYGISFVGNHILFGLYTTSVLQISAESSASNFSKWTHITCTYDGNKLNTGIHIYINGKYDVASRTNLGIYTGMVNTSSTFELGAAFRNRAGFTTWFNGSIAEVRIFNKQLTNAEIRALYKEYPHA